MDKRTIKNKVGDGKTVFQEFADFLAQDKGNRDAVYEVTVSEKTFTLFRRNDLDT